MGDQGEEERGDGEVIEGGCHDCSKSTGERPRMGGMKPSAVMEVNDRESQRTSYTLGLVWASTIPVHRKGLRPNYREQFLAKRRNAFASGTN